MPFKLGLNELDKVNKGSAGLLCFDWQEIGLHKLEIEFLQVEQRKLEIQQLVGNFLEQ